MTKSELAKTNSTAVVAADVLDMLEENEALGMDTLSASDKIIPQLKVAEASSDQLKPSNAKYIEDLKAGLLFNTATGEVYGKSALLSILGVFKTLTVWPSLDDITRVPPEEVVYEAVNPSRFTAIDTACERTADNKMVLNGTKKVNLSYQVLAVVVNEDGSFAPVVIDCGKTKFKNARQLNTLLDSIRFTAKDGSRKRAATCASLIKIEVIEARNDKNEWHEYKFSRVTDNDNLLSGGMFKAELLFQFINEAKQIREQLLKGTVKLDNSQDFEETSTAQAEVVTDTAEVFG